MYNVALNSDKPELTYDLISDDMKLVGKYQRKANLGYGTKILESKFVGFCFGQGDGWEQFALILLTVSGKAFYICPFLPKLARLNRVALEALSVELQLSGEKNSVMESWLKELLVQCEDNLSSNSDLETNPDLTEVSVHLHHPIYTIAPKLQGPVKFGPSFESNKVNLPQSIHWAHDSTVDIIAISFSNARLEVFIPLSPISPQWIEQDLSNDQNQWQLCGLEGFNLQDPAFPDKDQPLTVIRIEDGFILKHQTAILHWDISTWFTELQNSLKVSSSSSQAALNSDFIANVTSGTSGLFIMNDPSLARNTSIGHIFATHEKIFVIDDVLNIYPLNPHSNLKICANKANAKKYSREIKSYLKQTHLPDQPFVPSDLFNQKLPNCPNLETSQSNETLMKSFESHYDSLINRLNQLQQDQYNTTYRWELIDLEYSRQLKYLEYINSSVINTTLQSDYSDELNAKIQQAKDSEQNLRKRIADCIRKREKLILLESRSPIHQYDQLLSNFTSEKDAIQNKINDFKAKLQSAQSKPKPDTLSNEFISRMDAISNNRYLLERQLYAQNESISKTKLKLNLTAEKLALLTLGKSESS
jgi:hypothetical protein